MLEYALMKDQVIRNSSNKTLVITCLDLLDGVYQYTYDGKLITCKSESEFVDDIKILLNFKRALLSRSAVGELEVSNG